MRRLPALLIYLGLFLTFASNAWSEGRGIYVGGIVGASLQTDTPLFSPTLGTVNMEFHPGYTFGGFAGYDFGNDFRMEGELSYHENSIRTGGGGDDPQAVSSSIMLNGFYDITLVKALSLYLGGGLGIATAQLETISLSQVIDASESVFAYQLEAGFGWNYNPKTTFSLGYRFFDATDPEYVLATGHRVRMALENHEFILKMRYLFNL